MVTIEKIDTSLFSSLYEAFLIDDDPLSGEQDWRNVFDYAWQTDEGHCGYALLDGGEVVGMIGMVFSERFVAGEKKKFCNLHTWWVRDDHRGRSLSLLRPALRLKGCTITHFTPCDKVRAVSKRLGFKELNSQVTILPPFGIRRMRADESALTFDSQDIEGALTSHDRQIYLDHLPYNVGHLLFNDGSQTCYLLYTHVTRHRLPYCHIHYISNKAVFARLEPLVRSSLLRRHRARFVALDTRLVRDLKLRNGFKFWAPAHALYMSPDIQPEQIDNLYSDVVFLKLTVLPDMSHELRQLARRVWPLKNECWKQA